MLVLVAMMNMIQETLDSYDSYLYIYIHRTNHDETACNGL